MTDVRQDGDTDNTDERTRATSLGNPSLCLPGMLPPMGLGSWTLRSLPWTPGPDVQSKSSHIGSLITQN